MKHTKIVSVIMALAMLLASVPSSVPSVFAKSADSGTQITSETSSEDDIEVDSSGDDISVINGDSVSDTQSDDDISVLSSDNASDISVQASSLNQCYVLAYDVDKVIDGTTPFDENDDAGNDSGDSNGIVRSFDIINYTLKYTTALKDAESSGVDSTNVMVDFELPCDVKTATFNVDTMTWLLDKKLIYVYSDGTQSETYDSRKSVVNQILTGRRLLVNNESGNTVPGTGTLAIGVNVNAAVTGDVIHPTFTIWMEGNAETEKKTLDVSTKVSAAPKFDIEIKRNGNANLLGYYNPENKTATADYVNDGDLYGRLQYYTLSLRLQNDFAAKGMKGIEYPDGSDITFDVRMSESVNDKDVSNDANYKPLFWDYAMDNGSKSKGVLGRPMSPLGQNIASYGHWTTNTPYNNGNYSGGCYNGGSTIIQTDASDSNLLHVTLSGYQLDMKDFDFPNRWSEANYVSIDSNVGYISVCGLQLIGRFQTDVDVIENVGIVLEASNFHARSMSGIDVNSEVSIDNNISSVRVTNHPEGRHSKRNFYYLENDASARCSTWDAGDSYAYFGEKIRMEGHMVYTGDRYLEATNILQKFDDTAFDIPKGTTKYLMYYRSNGYSEVGPINTLFAAKPDKTGWTDDTEMNNTHEEQLIYFKSIDDLHDAGYICVGVLYEVRDSKLYPNNGGGCLSIQQMLEMKKTVKAGHVAQIKNDVRSWKSGTDYTYLDKTYDASIKAYGIGDMSWTSGKYADDYTKPTYRTDLNYGKAVYKDGTMVAGHTNSYQGGNSILIIGNKAAVGIKVADMTGDKSKSVYDLDAGERTAKFSVQPSTIITSLNSEVWTSDARDNLKVSVILPKGLHFNTMGVSLQPESVKENDDGTTKIVWKINDVKVGSKIDPITFSTTIGEEGTEHDVQHNDAFNVIAKITSDNDVRQVSVFNGNYAETQFSVIKLAASAITKRTLTPLVEKCEEIKYRLRYSNLSDTDALNAKLADLLPYDSDSRGSKFGGNYDVSDVKIDFSHAAKTFAYGMNQKDEFALFTSKDTSYRTKATLESLLTTSTGFDNLTKQSGAKINDEKKVVEWHELNLSDITTLGFYLGKVYGHEYVDVYLTLSPKDTTDSKQQPGDLYANHFIQYAENQASIVTSNVVKTQVVSRKLSGLAWIDADADGVRADSETLLKDVNVALYSTTKSVYDKSDTIVHVGDKTLYFAYDVFGKKVSNVKTDAHGHYAFSDLLAGTYYVGFSDKVKYHITRQDAGTDDAFDSDAELIDKHIFIKEIVLPDIKNMSYFSYESTNNDVGFIENTNIQIKKLDMQEANQLAGAKLAIYKESDIVDGKPISDVKPVVEFTTTDKTYIVTNILLAGQTYVLVEEAAPTGYEIAKPITFTVNLGKESQIVKMKDDYASYDVAVQKINKKDVRLAGAKLQVTGIETGGGSEITPIVWTSSKDKAEVLKLKPGTYMLSELEPPAGYDVTKDVPFTVHTDGNVYVNDVKVDVVNMIDAEMRASMITLFKYDVDSKTTLSDVTYQLKFVKSAVDASTDYHRLLKEGETTTAVTDANGQISFKNLQHGTYEITEVKTKDGLQLLKEPIEITLPITMTPDEVKRFNADTSKGVYDEENKVWQFYDATFTVTNDVTFGVPQAGAAMTIKRFVPIILSISILGLLCIVVFRRKKRVN